MLFLLVLFVPLIAAQQSRTCGTMRASFATDSKIVGGEPASNYAWPWQVYIALNGNFICGGTLVDKQYVVSAAHCVIGESSNADDFLIQVGAHYMSGSYYTGTTYRVSRVYVHENYVRADYGYDISLFQLANPVTLSDTVNVICLPPSVSFNIPMYSLTVISGFGLTSENGRLPYTLQQAVIQLLPTCSRVYNYDDSSQICAGIQQGGRDTCQGKTYSILKKE